MIADDASRGRAIGMAWDCEAAVAAVITNSAKANFFNMVFSFLIRIGD
jgi:hypothetical protein